MKRILSTLLAACMVLSMLIIVPFTASAAATGADESTVGYQGATVTVSTGTNLATVSSLADTVYIVNSADGLAKLATLAASNDFTGITVYLTASIVLPASFAGISTFAGTFDGQGKTITMNNAAANLFTALTGPAIVCNVVVAGTSKGIIGTATGDSDGAVQITNVKNESTISTNKASIGGILGQAAGGTVSVENCSNTGAITNTAGSGFSAGIVGEVLAAATVTVTNCLNDAPFIGREYIGGLVGFHRSGKELVITNCVNKGAIEGSAFMAGILGCSTGTAKLLNCTNEGTVAGKHASVNSKAIGGLVGQSSVLTLTDCLNTATGTITNVKQGTATSELGQFVGGLLGKATGNTLVWRCENHADVTGPDQKVGGIIGGGVSGYCQVDNSKNYGDIHGVELVGGIIGLSYFPGSLTSTYVATNGTTYTVNARYQHCTNEGKITATSQRAGGITGACWAYNGEVYLDCTNRGTVIGTNASGILGVQTVVAEKNPMLDIINCVNSAAIITESTNKVMGICGGYDSSATTFMQQHNVDNSALYAPVQWYGYQVKAAYTEGGVQYQDIRLVGTIDSLEYKSVGFTYEAINTAGTVLKSETYTCQYVYEELYAEGGNLKASEIRPNGYLFSLTLEKIPVSLGTVTFKVNVCAEQTQADGGKSIEGKRADFRHVIGDKAASYTANNQYSVVLGEATVVYQSPTNMNQDWGYYQFPRLYYTNTGAILASWNYSEDTVVGGGGNTAAIKNAISYDGGKTWTPISDADISTYKKVFDVPTKDGFYFAGFGSGGSYEIPASQLSGVPVYATGTSSGTTFNVYLASDIANLTLTDVNGKSVTAFKNPNQISMSECNNSTGASRSSVKTLNWTNMPVYGQVLANGNIILTTTSQLMAICNNYGMVEKDGVLYYATYTRGFALDGTPVNSLDNVYYSVYIFSSTDGGDTWNCISRINRNQLPTLTSGTYGYDGPCEPSMTVMPDGSLVLVGRTGSGDTNKYVSFFARSTDNGKTWDVRKFGDTGVLPQILTLDCGVTVSSYGRPGLYLNTTANADGLGWQGVIQVNDLSAVQSGQSVQSCFYTGLLPLDSHTALLIYTDFNHPNGSGGYSKAIMARTITIVAK